MSSIGYIAWVKRRPTSISSCSSTNAKKTPGKNREINNHKVSYYYTPQWKSFSQYFFCNEPLSFTHFKVHESLSIGTWTPTTKGNRKRTRVKRTMKRGINLCGSSKLTYDVPSLWGHVSGCTPGISVTSRKTRRSST